MRRADFHYDLPPELIAQHPAVERGDARLLCLDRATGAVWDRGVRDLPGLLRPGDLLVYNDTRVIQARLHGRKASGGRVEVLVERILDRGRVTARIRASRAPREGSGLLLNDGIEVEVLGRRDDLFELRFDDPRPVDEILAEHGTLPLPPYIERVPEAADAERYQTVYADRPGAVAAPTAGLHFDAELLRRLRERGVQTAAVTLHVGAGTYTPVRVDDVREHRMHSEWVEVDERVCAAVAATRLRGGRVVAVGTTTVRSLETAARRGHLTPFRGETDIFLYPGVEFQVVDALLTNFHLPESTLLMLVCAFGGYDRVMAAYRHAVARRYRFFSYGDAMFLYDADPRYGVR